jgi:hypothetical protein
VKFTVTREVAVPPPQVAAAYGSPAFYKDRPARDDIAVLGVLDHETTDDHVLIAVRFAFTGSVSAAVRRVVDPATLSWVTRMEVRPAELRAVWEVRPDHHAERLRAKGTYHFEPGPFEPGPFEQGEPGQREPVSTVVRVEGDLSVSVPIVGRSVERAIVSGLRDYLEDEVASIPDLGR